jgi:hypothetical protein
LTEGRYRHRNANIGKNKGKYRGKYKNKRPYDNKSLHRDDIMLRITSCSTLNHSECGRASSTWVWGLRQTHILPLPSHPLHPNNRSNALGWRTGYSAITTTSDQPNIVGRGLAGSETIRETTTQIVPDHILLPKPVRAITNDPVPNRAGWNTGYSTVTSTYELPAPLGPPATS